MTIVIALVQCVLKMYEAKLILHVVLKFLNDTDLDRLFSISAQERVE